LHARAISRASLLATQYFSFFKVSERDGTGKLIELVLCINEIPRAVNWREKKKAHTHLESSCFISFFSPRTKTSLAFKATLHQPLPLSTCALPVPFLSYIVALIIASKGPALLLYLAIDDVPLSCTVKENPQGR